MKTVIVIKNPSKRIAWITRNQNWDGSDKEIMDWILELSIQRQKESDKSRVADDMSSLYYDSGTQINRYKMNVEHLTPIKGLLQKVLNNEGYRVIK
ncbi:hypothetical protein LRP49_03750 [Enterovibrio sp. ZSDZ35]|uniref:Uncharacterized protein n=1 Tax=Enterovibrio qingdaonensis TaxID=2899818 RepID=A0ABT5QH63_9GAMM|nr:hypothetical protein [Enterovibrio sp. ZSDZ35]MDD1780308.1 hypothetical protein [Enterovibrio sp. ZSDZ35]